MKYIKEPSKKLPVILNREVVVAGAGPSGIIAAISSAKTGAKTILIERYASLGGNLLIGLPFLGMLDQQGKQIVKGIPEDLFSRLRRAGGADKHRSCPFHVSYTIFSPEILQKVVLEMLEEAGVETKIHYKQILNEQYTGLYTYPYADSICKNAISLPIYPYLKLEEVDYICERINKFNV